MKLQHRKPEKRAQRAVGSPADSPLCAEPELGRTVLCCGGPEGKGQGRKVFKDIGLKNLPNFMKIRNLQIQEGKENLRKEQKKMISPQNF